MTDTDGVLMTSYSDITRADSCARSWYLGTYRGLVSVKTKQTGPLPFGSRFHLALEVIAKRDEWTHSAVESVWNELMAREFDLLRMTGGVDKDLVKESKLGHAMLTGLVTWREQTRQNTRYLIVGVENKYGEFIHITLPDGRVVRMLFRGKLDIIEQRLSDGAMIIVDWKTTANLAEVTLRTQELSNQGPMYFMLMQESGETDWLWGVSYVLARKVQQTATAKPPFYHRLDVQITPERLQAARDNLMGKAIRVVELGERLDRGESHRTAAPYSVGWWCHSCPFKLPCGQMQRGNFAGGEDMLRDRFTKGDVWDRYREDEERLRDLL